VINKTIIPQMKTEEKHQVYQQADLMASAVESHIHQN
jgi:hypothetical protein